MPAQIKAWRGACEQANDRAGIGIGIGAGAARLSRATKAEKKRIRDLARELARQIGSGADRIA